MNQLVKNNPHDSGGIKHQLKCQRTSLRAHFAWVIVQILIVFHPSLNYAQQARFVSFIADTQIENAIICSPDGKNVYAAGLYTIAAFERQADGTLKTLQVLNNDHNGIKGIHHIIDLAITPDGRYLYALNHNDRSLLLFSRDTNRGEIKLTEVIRDSVFGPERGTAPSVERNYKLLISPDGGHLYWFYSGIGLLAAFKRDLHTGRLTKIQILKNGATELGHLNVPWWVAISPDGKHFYGGGGNTTQILILSRNQETDQITYVKNYDTGSHRREDGKSVALLLRRTAEPYMSRMQVMINCWLWLAIMIMENYNYCKD